MFLKYPFSLRLDKPLNLKRRLLSSQNPYQYESTLISISNAEGLTGYGEIVKQEKLAEEIATLHLKILESHWDFQLESLPQKIPVAAMLEQVDLEEAQTLVAQGFRTLKFKVGDNWQQEAEKLIKIREAIGTSIDIRLDANQKLDFQTAVKFSEAILKIRIAYFEEPLKDINQIPELVQKTGMPVALDESLLNCETLSDEILDHVTTFALKIFLMPHLKAIQNCLNLAQEKELDIAICSAFESGYSLYWQVMLAACLGPASVAAGLSTYRWFQEDLINPAFSVSEGCVLVEDAYEFLFRQHVAFVRLREFDFCSPGL